MVIRHDANAGTFQQAAGSASSGLGNFYTGLNLPDTKFTTGCLDDLAAFKNQAFLEPFSRPRYDSRTLVINSWITYYSIAIRRADS